MAMDDIKGLETGSLTEKPSGDVEETQAPAPRSPREVGPESEVRGGPEAPSLEE